MIEFEFADGVFENLPISVIAKQKHPPRKPREISHIYASEFEGVPKEQLLNFEQKSKFSFPGKIRDHLLRNGWLFVEFTNGKIRFYKAQHNDKILKISPSYSKKNIVRSGVVTSWAFVRNNKINHDEYLLLTNEKATADCLEYDFTVINQFQKNPGDLVMRYSSLSEEESKELLKLTEFKKTNSSKWKIYNKTTRSIANTTATNANSRPKIKDIIFSSLYVNYHFDHRISVLNGFYYGIPPKVLSSYVNLRLLEGAANLHKGPNNEEGYDILQLIQEYDQEFGIGSYQKALDEYKGK
jgi:hypothetical protein